LAVCLSIVERHGGTIKVCSEEAVGTTFLVSFPIHSDNIPFDTSEIKKGSRDCRNPSFMIEI
jgi:K+-sensing histidine kinase KdpD